MTGPFPAEPDAHPIAATDGEAGPAPGETYRVIAPFVDADGTAHAVGETWSVAAVRFDASENAIVIVACFDGPAHWRIPLSLANAEQQDVIEHSDRYFAPVTAEPALADAVASWGRTLARMWSERRRSRTRTKQA